MILALTLSLVVNLFLVSLTLFLVKHLEKKERNQERERINFSLREKEWADRVMFLSGKTWVLPPRENLDEEELIDDETKLLLAGWMDA